MSAPPIRIRIGASVDGTVERSFAHVESRSRKAAGVIVRERQKAATAEEKAAKTAAKAQEREAQKAARAVERAAERETRAHERAAERAVKAMEQTRRKTEQELERKARAAERAAEREARSHERAQRRMGESFARRTSHRSTRFLMPTSPFGSMAMRHGRNLARGAGVETDLGSVMGRTIEQEEIASRISNKAFRPGEEGAAGQRVAPKELVKQARSTAFDVGGDTTGMLNALFAFTSQSGDLAAARASMDDLAKLAKSQGADFEETFFAAGKINNALEQQPEFMHDAAKRAKEVSKIMNILVAQTKIGSVEFDKLAKEIPKVSGLTGLFGGSTERSMGQLTTVLQLAEKGQAPGAATAGTQTSALVRELVKGPVAKRFEDRGIRLRGDDGQLREIKSIIIDLLTTAESESKRTGRGSSEIVTDVLRNSRAFLPVFDLLDTFTKRGGGAEGVKAVEEVFRNFGKGISADQLKGDFDAAMKTTASRVNRFNIHLEETGDKLREKLLPAFERATPMLIDFAETVGNVTTWVVENPKKAIGGAIVASIGRASLESVFRAQIEQMILGSGGRNAAAFAGATNKFVAGLNAASVGISAFMAATGLIHFVANEEEKEDREDAAKRQGTLGHRLKANQFIEQARLAEEAGDYEQRDQLLKKAHGEASKAVAGGKRDISKIEDDQSSVKRWLADNLLPMWRLPTWLDPEGGAAAAQASGVRESRDAAEKAMLESLKLSLAANERHLEAISKALTNTGIKVNNLPEGGGSADIPGRVKN